MICMLLNLRSSFLRLTPFGRISGDTEIKSLSNRSKPSSFVFFANAFSGICVISLCIRFNSVNSGSFEKSTLLISFIPLSHACSSVNEEQSSTAFGRLSILFSCKNNIFNDPANGLRLPSSNVVRLFPYKLSCSIFFIPSKAFLSTFEILLFSSPNIVS